MICLQAFDAPDSDGFVRVVVVNISAPLSPKK